MFHLQLLKIFDFCESPVKVRVFFLLNRQPGLSRNSFSENRDPTADFFCVPIKCDCSLALISTDIPMQQPSVYYAQAQPIVMPISPTPMVQGMSPDFGRGQVFPQVITLFFTIKYSYPLSESRTQLKILTI